MEEKNKFLPAISNFVPKAVKNLRYSRKVKIADIKQYLVDEYKLTRELDKENKSLRKELDDAKVVEDKYQLTLITLDEYKERLKDRKEDIELLKKEKQALKDDLKILKDEKNTLIIANKKLQKDSEKIINDFKKEYTNRIIQEIKKTKGNLSKQKICEIIERID